MTKLILSAIVVIGTLGYALWKRYGSKEAELEKLYAELNDVQEKMSVAMAAGNSVLYHKFAHKRLQINKRINNLRR